VVASKVFQEMDKWMHLRQRRFVRHRHPNKPWKWCRYRYWGKLNPERKDTWVFGDKRTGAYLLKFSWFKIVRHVLVRGTASRDDPSLREYWWARQRVNLRNLTLSDVKLAESQNWRCPVCGMDLINGEDLQRHHKQPRTLGGTDSYSNRELVHLYCHQQRHAQLRGEKAAAVGDEPIGVRCEG
jgi:RNA-directed DNA polymerase